MKKAGWILIMILLLLGGYFMLSSNNTDKQGVSYTLTGDEKRLLLTGDIIMRRGDGLVSDGIAKMLQEPFDITHCGVILEEQCKLWVVHAMQDKERGVDGIFAQSLDQFVAESRLGSVIVVRYKPTQDRTPLLTERIHYYLKQDIPFDLGFDAADSTEFYCSELLQHLFLETYGVDIFPITLSVPTADLLKYTHLFDTTAFQPVLNHHLRVVTAPAGPAISQE